MKIMRKKNKNLILWGAVLILFLGIVMLVVANVGDGSSNPTTYSASSLVASENSFDFNTILMGDGIVSHEFEVVNIGDEPIEIGKVYTSCACTTAYIIDGSGKKYGKFGMPGHSGLRAVANAEVQPGESIIVEAVYDPAFHGPSGVGLAERSIYIETNSAKSPKLELKFQATVTR